MNVNRFIMHMEDVEVLPSSRALGDVEGHPFHGNQWTSGAAQLARDKAANDPRHFLDTPKGALSGLLHHETVNIDRHDVRDLLNLPRSRRKIQILRTFTWRAHNFSVAVPVVLRGRRCRRSQASIVKILSRTSASAGSRLTERM